MKRTVTEDAKKNGGFEEQIWFTLTKGNHFTAPESAKKLKIMAYNITLATTAVICYVSYRILLWAVRILWYCFKAVLNLVLWLMRAAFWTMLYLTRIIF